MATLNCGAQLVGISKRFGSITALADINWSLEPGACLGLVGSSGSGKTTLLRIVAGLEQPDAGTVRYTTPRRPVIGMVFQNLGLWPHLTARQHVECVLKSARSSGRLAAESLLDEVRLPRTAWDRLPNQLSGGEGQRVALARALACDPQLLLLDEPLAHLDAMLRTDLLQQLAELIYRRGVTSLYVTHAWDEASQTCQCIGVLEQGRLEQAGTADELYWRPANQIVARLTGPVLTLPRACLAGGMIAPDPQSPQWAGLLPDEKELLWLRPQQVRVGSPQGANQWRVADCRPAGAGWRLQVEGNGKLRLALLTGAPVSAGDIVGLTLCASGGR